MQMQDGRDANAMRRFYVPETLTNRMWNSLAMRGVVKCRDKHVQLGDGTQTACEFSTEKEQAGSGPDEMNMTIVCKPEM